MSDYTPTTDRVRADYAETYEGTDERRYARFDRWLAEVERAAAEKAWDRCVGEMPIDPDWKNFYGDNNPYRAEAYRQGRKE